MDASRKMAAAHSTTQHSLSTFNSELAEQMVHVQRRVWLCFSIIILNTYKYNSGYAIKSTIFLYLDSLLTTPSSYFFFLCNKQNDVKDAVVFT